MPEEVVIKVEGLRKYFEVKKGFFGFLSEPLNVKAVDDVDFEIKKGEILGLVGESGCGKTTCGRLLTRLDDPTGGSVFFQGRDISLLRDEDLKVFRRNIQMVFQDPYESLSPRTTVLQTVMEPLINHGIGDSFEERVEITTKALEDAGLAPAREYLNRYPHELSGGQRQRVSIARALVIEPRVIVADEPVSMLDVSIRAGVLNLMLDLRDKYRIPYLFITHDIAVARYVSDRLAVMYLGKIVEIGETDAVVFESKHPYTQALISAVPVPDPEHKHGRATIVGEIPSAIDLPLGCRFRPRCLKAFEMCGWEGSDLAEWLLEEEKVAEPEHPMSDHIDKLRPDGFVLSLTIKPNGDPKEVKAFLDGRADALKASKPMFKALASVDAAFGDREVAVRCSSVKVDGDLVAQEVHEMLEAAVDYEAPDHPMHGTITGIDKTGDRVTVYVGREDRAPAEGVKSKVESTEGFIRDFIDNRRKEMGYSEFKGVRRVSGDAAASVVVAECGPATMSARRVAMEVRDIIEHDFMAGPSSKMYESFLPLEIRGKEVIVRTRGSEERWDDAVRILKEHFVAKADSDTPVAKGVKDVRLRMTKGAKDMVTARFMTVEEPPLVDTGGGHRVACHLYVRRYT